LKWSRGEIQKFLGILPGDMGANRGKGQFPKEDTNGQRPGGRFWRKGWSKGGGQKDLDRGVFKKRKLREKTKRKSERKQMCGVAKKGEHAKNCRNKRALGKRFR